MKTELFWLDHAWKGRLALAPRPRGGDWLEDEMRAWKQAGVDIVVCLLTPDEIVDLNLVGEAALSKANGMEFISFPIIDRGVPDRNRTVLELLRTLEKSLLNEKAIVVHCRQGLGRSALIAACLLVLAGYQPESAFHQITVARGCPAPETEEQRQWVTAFAHDISVPTNR